MRKLYATPEAEIVYLAAEENLAFRNPPLKEILPAGSMMTGMEQAVL